MKLMVQLTTVLIIVQLAMAPTATAEVPRMINYQGWLTDAAGAPLDTTVAMVFSIYDSNLGVTSKWTETHSSVTVSNGLFSVLLGMGTPPVPIEDSVFNQPERWLGITVGTGAELRPLIRLASVGYSHRVSTVDGATGGVVSGDVTIQSDLDVDGDIHSSGTISSGNSITIDGTLNTISSSTEKISFTDDSLVNIGGLGVGTSAISTHGVVIVKTLDVTAPTQAKGLLAQITNPGSGWTWGGDFKVEKQNEGTCFGVTGLADLDGGQTGDIAVGAQGYATSNVNATGMWGYASVDSSGSGVSMGGSLYAYNHSMAGTQMAYGVFSEASSDQGMAYGGWFRAGPASGTATHYGIYATALGAGPTYAGYFDGRVTVTDRVGIGTTNPQGALDVSSTTGAFIVPRMTTAERDALTAVNGMIIYNTTDNQFNFYENGAWVTK